MGRSNNIPPSTRQSPLLTPVFEDWVDVGIVLTGPGVSDLLHLIELKEADLLPATDSFGGVCWAVRAGKHASSSNFNASVTISSAHLHVGIQRFRKDDPSKVRVFVNASGHALRQYGGLESLWDWFTTVLTTAGLAIEEEALSRIDIATDIALAYSIIDDQYRRKCHVSRANSGERFIVCEQQTHKRATGISLGSSIKSRIYNKKIELTNASPEKRALQHRSWEADFGSIPDSISRIELQLRREPLKTLGTPTVHSWLKDRARVWMYLTSTFLRFTETPADTKNRNQSRIPTWSVWQSVQALSQAPAATRGKITGTPSQTAMTNRGLRPFIQLALLHGLPATPESVLGVMKDMLADQTDMNAFEEQVDLARRALITSYGESVTFRGEIINIGSKAIPQIRGR